MRGGSSRRMNCVESRWYCIGSLSAVVQYKFIYQSSYLPVNLFSRVIIYHAIPWQFCAKSSEPRHPIVAGQPILLIVFLLGAAPESYRRDETWYSEIGAHVGSNLCYLICLRHYIRSRAATNRICFSTKRLFSFMRAQQVLCYHLK